MTIPDISAAPNVLFLGAGASRPLGKKLMGEFVISLKENPQIANDYLFSDIVQKKPDLEFLLQELQEIGTKGYLAFRVERANMLQQFKEVGAAASALRFRIEREVFLHYRGFDNDKETTTLFLPLFERLAKEITPSPLVVFTTNYDPAIETFCRLSGKYECVDGFVHDPESKEYVWSSNGYESTIVRTDRRPVILFKLHGSTDWVKRGERLVKGGAPIFAGGDPKHSNMMIYPATEKIAYFDPFFTCYTYLEECLSRARYCLVIGYSFRDYDALTRMRAAMRKNPGLVLEVLDPNATTIVDRVLDFEIKAKPITGMLSTGHPLPVISPFVKS